MSPMRRNAHVKLARCFQPNTTENHVLAVNIAGSSSVVFVCEHASNHNPEKYNCLSLSKSDRTRHAAWDPGAFAVAEKKSEKKSEKLDAPHCKRRIAVGL